MSTIYALASAPGRAGVSVVRISGPQALMLLDALAPGQRDAIAATPRHARLCALRHPRSGELLDRALVLYFKAPASFTGEDVIELHLHGGRAVLAGVLDALAGLADFRLAQPGAFSRRAFENGKMDLTEAEAIADLIDAETAAQRRQALRQMDGALGALYQGWAARLKTALAHIEATIDFVEEDDLPEDLAANRRADLQEILTDMTAHLNDHHRGEKLRTGLSVVLLGPPNAGKSSLLNALAARHAAIVTDEAGTTRDIIEVPLDLGGYPVVLTDTAGLRDSENKIEREGIRLAKARADEADIKILLFDGAHWPARDPETFGLAGPDSLMVVNKADLMDPTAQTTGAGEGAQAGPLFVSARTGQGMDALKETLVRMLRERFDVMGSPLLTRARHREALTDAVAHLARACQATDIELCAEDVRLAMRALGRITGTVDVEDLLDVIFSSFCLGK